MKTNEKIIHATEANSGNLYLVTDLGRVFIRVKEARGSKTWYKLDLPNESCLKES